MALANPSIALFRSGLTVEAQNTALRATKVPCGDGQDVASLSAHGVDLCCSALRRDSYAVVASTTRMRAALDECPTDSLRAHALLWLADGLMLFGDETTAMVHAAEALALEPSPPLAGLGLWARWSHNMLRRTKATKWEGVLRGCVDQIGVADRLDEYETATAALGALADTRGLSEHLGERAAIHAGPDDRA